MSNNKKISFILLFLILVAVLAYIFIFEGINSKIEDEIQSGEPVVLLFSASWCGSCTKLKPRLQAALKEKSHLNYHKIGDNLNKLRKKVLFEKYNVHGIPTLILFKDGKEYKRIVGVQTQEVLEDALSSLN